MTVVAPYRRADTNGEVAGTAFSRETRTLRAMHKHRLIDHYYEPFSRQKGLTFQFYALANKWKRETILVSSTSKMCMHPSYQRIIGMGSVVVPFILRELEHSPSQWFWALKSITGEDPVPNEHLGDIKRMAQDWLSWAKLEGYKW